MIMSYPTSDRIAEQITQIKRVRAVRLQEAREAIRSGRAYLETAWGRRKVTGYDDETGWAYTEGDRSFMVALESIKF
jgi:hypothetical protein